MEIEDGDNSEKIIENEDGYEIMESEDSEDSESGEES